MSARMTPCARCARHVRSADATCPFCDAPTAQRATAAGALVGVALAMSACAAPPGPAPVYGGPPDPVRTVAPPDPTTSTPPTPTTAPTPSAQPTVVTPPDNRNAPAYGLAPRPTPVPEGKMQPPGAH